MSVELRHHPSVVTDTPVLSRLLTYWTGYFLAVSHRTYFTTPYCSTPYCTTPHVRYHTVLYNTVLYHTYSITPHRTVPHRKSIIIIRLNTIHVLPDFSSTDSAYIIFGHVDWAVMAASTPVNLPIIDFTACNLTNEDLDLFDDGVKRVADEVVKGLEDYGAVYLINHGMSMEGVSYPCCYRRNMIFVIWKNIIISYVVDNYFLRLFCTFLGQVRPTVTCVKCIETLGFDIFWSLRLHPGVDSFPLRSESRNPSSVGKFRFVRMKRFQMTFHLHIVCSRWKTCEKSLSNSSPCQRRENSSAFGKKRISAMAG